MSEVLGEVTQPYACLNRHGSSGLTQDAVQRGHIHRGARCRLIATSNGATGACRPHGRGKLFRIRQYRRNIVGRTRAGSRYFHRSFALDRSRNGFVQIDSCTLGHFYDS